MKVCGECYSSEARITPLLRPEECLRRHTQYICGSCGRCICIERDSKRGLQRWNFPFGSLEAAKLYLRTADATVKASCAIYEIENDKGRCSYKIFKDSRELEVFLKKNKNKSCTAAEPVFQVPEYREFPNTQIRRLTAAEIEKYLSEQ